MSVELHGKTLGILGDFYLYAAAIFGRGLVAIVFNSKAFGRKFNALGLVEFHFFSVLVNQFVCHRVKR